MNMIDIIVKKKNKEILSKEEIQYAIDGYLNGTIPDYQMSSLLMAILLNGMDFEETYYLTDIMLNSGETIDLSGIEGDIIDKHSTGGVGDKTTLILAPILASLGLKVAKMSGRGLGHTGGTIDKLESIEGFQTAMTKEEFIDQVNQIGLAITSQTGNIAPADKKIYALRDVTGTTESIPLIASSIMSKKLASGSDNIIIDLKVGNGALMKTEEDARTLANYMIEIGKKYGKKVVCVLTNMNEPLGKMIGNGLEVKESIDALKGKSPHDLKELITTLTCVALKMTKKMDKESVQKWMDEKIQNGEAYHKFEEFVACQKGNIQEISISNKVLEVRSPKEGFIKSINTFGLGEIVKVLGGGRMTKEDTIDYGVGIELNKKVGDLVFENECLLKIYHHQKDIRLDDVISCFEFSEEPVSRPKLIIDIIE